MAPQRHRAQRAAIRSRYRKPKRRRRTSLGWNAVIAVIVVAGALGVMLARSNNQANADKPPLMANAATGQPGDHWHAYLGIDICGEWLPNAPAFEARADNPSVNAGIHSHGDGLIHIHPFVHSEEGDNATVGKFMTYGGWQFTSDSGQLWSGPQSNAGKLDWKTGDKCTFGDSKGKTVQMTWTVNNKKHTGDPSGYHPRNNDIVAIYFLPKGAETPEPPDAETALANIADLGTTPATAATTTTTAAPSTSSP